MDDTISADQAYRLATDGVAMLWRGDFQNARQLLRALGGRIPTTPAPTFQAHRQHQARRARVLAMVLVLLDSDYVLDLRRAPDVRQACTEVHGQAKTPSVMPLRELLGVVGAHEWRRSGVRVPELDARIRPHYGVFSPVRGEYVRLVAEAPLPTRTLAFDIGTGTGVLAAVLARRGVERVVATDQDMRAVACARENLAALGYEDRTEVQRVDLFPRGRAPLVVCNPPWLPARPTSPLERAVYDPGSRMLYGFLDRLGRHLTHGGEGWLILSDLAERLGLRARADLLAAFDRTGLEVVGRSTTTPQHPRAFSPETPFHMARAAEITTLWRVRVRADTQRPARPEGP
ncbi:class I SAM-dependent methyltransferase [Allokutzneria sp. A3M-2-11 16]|uniref:class I SAM-dependent methyltransferase n=1 Tax=Allokutzneria sp. A3M-2-11 16 TaxID=2962043 RepID=UPI0027E28DB3|nr:class I SAM-dependent methyltransferase [Allokutzneria sp. A3M-2-11 16]